MPCDESRGDAVTSGDGDTEAFDSEVVLQAVFHKVRAALVADIVGHPEQSPSLPELEYMNPSLESAVIEEQLQQLEAVGVVVEQAVAPAQRVDGRPERFYALTAPARQLFDHVGIFPEAAWRRQYQRVEKPAEILALEALPRPDADDG